MEVKNSKKLKKNFTILGIASLLTLQSTIGVFADELTYGSTSGDSNSNKGSTSSSQGSTPVYKDQGKKENNKSNSDNWSGAKSDLGGRENKPSPAPTPAPTPAPAPKPEPELNYDKPAVKPQTRPHTQPQPNRQTQPTNNNSQPSRTIRDNPVSTPQTRRENINKPRKIRNDNVGTITTPNQSRVDEINKDSGNLEQNQVEDSAVEDNLEDVINNSPQLIIEDNNAKTFNPKFIAPIGMETELSNLEEMRKNILSKCSQEDSYSINKIYFELFFGRVPDDVTHYDSFSPIIMNNKTQSKSQYITRAELAMIVDSIYRINNKVDQNLVNTYGFSDTKSTVFQTSVSRMVDLGIINTKSLMVYDSYSLVTWGEFKTVLKKLYMKLNEDKNGNLPVNWERDFDKLFINIKFGNIKDDIFISKTMVVNTLNSLIFEEMSKAGK